MAKKKTAKLIPFPKSVEVHPVAPLVVEAAPPPVVEELQTSAPILYAFKTRVRCPKCSDLNTIRRGDNGDTQYRLCRRPSCNHKFSVKGEPI
jgi:phage FluMu protein Com